MPLQSWRCTTCGAPIDVIRSFDDSALPPSGEEIVSDGVPMCVGTVDPANPGGGHCWKKHIGAPNVAKGPSWGPGKGYY